MKLTRLFLLLAVLLSPIPTSAQSGGTCPGIPHPIKAYAHEVITVSSTAIGFTLATMQTGSHSPEIASVTMETASIRYFIDGGTPTATVGHLVPLETGVTAVSFFVCGGDSVRAWRAIRTSGDATLTVTYLQ